MRNCEELFTAKIQLQILLSDVLYTLHDLNTMVHTLYGALRMCIDNKNTLLASRCITHLLLRTCLDVPDSQLVYFWLPYIAENPHDIVYSTLTALTPSKMYPPAWVQILLLIVNFFLHNECVESIVHRVMSTLYHPVCTTASMYVQFHSVTTLRFNNRWTFGIDDGTDMYYALQNYIRYCIIWVQVLLMQSSHLDSIDNRVAVASLPLLLQPSSHLPAPNTPECVQILTTFFTDFFTQFFTMYSEFQIQSGGGAVDRLVYHTPYTVQFVLLLLCNTFLLSHVVLDPISVSRSTYMLARIFHTLHFPALCDTFSTLFCRFDLGAPL
uniref:Putative fused cobalt transport protein CbiMQ n=1 Tax=Lygus hesperus TaxID=30085 RepID=A0A0A9VND3_LYGHE